MKAIRVGKWRESVLSQLTCTPINGRHALYNLIRSIRGHRFLMLMRPWLRGPICTLIFVEQDADVAADRAPMSGSLQLPLQSFLTRSVWDTRPSRSCRSYRQKKFSEGLRRWPTAPDAGPSWVSPGHAGAPRRPGKSCTAGRARTHGAAAAAAPLSARRPRDNATCRGWPCLRHSSPTSRQGVINRVWFHSPQIQTQWEKLVLRWKWCITRGSLNRKDEHPFLLHSTFPLK